MWATPSHPPDLGADLKFLQRTFVSDSSDSGGLGEEKHQDDCSSGLCVIPIRVQVGEKNLFSVHSFALRFLGLKVGSGFNVPVWKEIRDVDLSLLELR